MNGISVLEELLGEVDATQHFRKETYKGIVLSSEPRVRTIIRRGTVFGVHEFCPVEIDPRELYGEEVEFNHQRLSNDPNGLAYLYETTKRQRDVSCQDDLVLVDDYSAQGVPRTFKAKTIWNSVAIGEGEKFRQDLKPNNKYSIVTPIFRIDFPVIGAWRGSQFGGYSPTNHTAIITCPYSITPNQDSIRIFEMFGIKQDDPQYLVKMAEFSEQAMKVFNALHKNASFHGLTQQFIERSAQLDALKREEHVKNMGRQ
jgi:hypothetical protein